MWIEDEDKLKEECGVFGIFSKTDIQASHLAYYGLYALQHRGQESAGIVVNDGEKLSIHKAMGLVSDIFNEDLLNTLSGNSAIGHVRYSTSGESSSRNAQPLISEFKLGSIAIAHNGTLINSDVIRGLLEDSGSIFQTSIDTEVIINLIARQSKKGLEYALVDAIQAIKGSFAIVILTEKQLIGVRDPYGIRPLCLGMLGESYILASESCAIESIGGEIIRDIEPGEIVIVDENGVKSIKYAENTPRKSCSFEHIYFARPDSVIDGINVYEARVKAGMELYEKYPVEADVVIGVPDSGLASAVGFSKASGIPNEMGIIKNKYIGRTFIAPTQEMRERAVSVKLNVLKSIVNGRRVVLIDDSIVRGTTGKRLIEILRRAGATEVHFRVASPMVGYPCHFGIDTPYRKDLMGSEASTEQMREMIGADSLGFLTIEDLVKSLGGTDDFCLGCFNGIYPMATPVEQFQK